MENKYNQIKPWIREVVAKQLIVHKRIGGTDATGCGYSISGDVIVSNKWEDVTCPNCLKEWNKK